jgi:capsular polysaccharide biosynthesis protein
MLATTGPVPAAVAADLSGTFAATKQTVSGSSNNERTNSSTANVGSRAKRAPSPSQADAAAKPAAGSHSISYLYGNHAVTVSAFAVPATRSVRITAQSKSRSEAIRVANLVASELKTAVSKAGVLPDAHLASLTARRAAAAATAKGVATTIATETAAGAKPGALRALENRRDRAAETTTRLDAQISAYTGTPNGAKLTTLQPATSNQVDVVTYRPSSNSNFDHSPSAPLRIAIGGLLGLLAGLGIIALMHMFSSPRERARRGDTTVDLRDADGAPAPATAVAGDGGRTPDGGAAPA